MKFPRGLTRRLIRKVIYLINAIVAFLANFVLIGAWISGHEEVLFPFEFVLLLIWGELIKKKNNNFN